MYIVVPDEFIPTIGLAICGYLGGMSYWQKTRVIVVVLGDSLIAPAGEQIGIVLHHSNSMAVSTPDQFL